MRFMKVLIGSAMIAAMLSAGVLIPARAWSQASEHLQHVEKQLADRPLE